MDREMSTPARLFEQIYASDPDGGPDMGVTVLKKMVSDVRRKLRPGWRIAWVDYNGVRAACAGGVAWKLERVMEADEVFESRQQREHDRKVADQAERDAKAAAEKERRERAPVPVGSGRVYRP